MTTRRISAGKDDLFLEVQTGRHPEGADRLRAIPAKRDLTAEPSWI